MPVTDCLRDRLGPAAHEGRALATVNGERWRRYRSHSRPGQSEVADDRRLIDQGVRGSLEGRPERRISHLDDDLVRYAHQPRLEQLDRVAATAGRDEPCELNGQVLARSRGTIVDHDRRFVQGQLRDVVATSGGLEREDGAG